jgi:hypothetical protein
MIRMIKETRRLSGRGKPIHNNEAGNLPKQLVTVAALRKAADEYSERVAEDPLARTSLLLVEPHPR